MQPYSARLLRRFISVTGVMAIVALLYLIFTI